MAHAAGPSAERVARMHQDIENMTRMLELEKRRVQRLEKELVAARKARHMKIMACRPSSGRKTRCPPRAALTDSMGSTGKSLVPLSPKSPGAASRVSPRPSSAMSRHTTSRSLTGTAVGPPACADVGVPVPDTDRKPPLKTLLHRVEVQRARLDRVKQENKDLRSEVDEVRQCRLTCDQIFNRLKRDIKERSHQLSDFVEETAASRAVHGDALHRVAVIKRQREVERATFKRKVMSLRDDIKQHIWEKKEKEVELQRAENGVMKRRELVVPEEELGFSETSMMRRIMKTAFLNCIQRRHIKQHQKSIEVFGQAFATIKQATGIELIEEIVKIFVSLESKNFSLLTYVNHMNQEIEGLEARRRARQRHEAAQQKHAEHREQVRQHALQDVQKQLSSTSMAISEGRESCTQHGELIQAICPLILKVADRLQEEQGHLREAADDDWGREEDIGGVLGISEPLTEDTLLAWLEALERALGKFRDLLPGDARDRDAVFPYTAASKTKQLPPKSYQLTPLVKTQELPCAMNSANEELGASGGKRPPSGQPKMMNDMEEDDEEEDFDYRPLPLHDLRARAEQAVMRKRRRGTTPRQPNTGMQSVLSASLGSTGHSVAGKDPEAMSKSPSIMGSGRNKSVDSVADSPHIGSAKRGTISFASDTRGRSDSVVSGASNTAANSGLPTGFGDKGEGRQTSERSSADGTTSPTSVEALTKEDPVREESVVSDAEAKRAILSKESASVQPGAVQSRLSAAQEPSSPSLRGAKKQATADVEADDDVSEEQLNMAFLTRYKMSKQELHVMAHRLGITMSNLCYLKQEFDYIDEDRSGYIDARELRRLLKRLGEELSDDELEAAFADLDADGSGEIEFFEFVDWFTSGD